MIELINTIAIEIGDNAPISAGDCLYTAGFTTNKNYIGHYALTIGAGGPNKIIPVYRNRLLKEGEIKYIMNNQEIKTLDEGRYLAKVEQVYEKCGKDDRGEEDQSKKLLVIELNVKDHSDRFYYVNFKLEGYNDNQLNYSKLDMEKIMAEFDIEDLKELEGKIVILSAVKNNGYTNYFIHAKRDFFDGKTIFQFDGESKFPCIIKKLYRQSKEGEKYVAIADVTINDKTIEEFKVYDVTRDIDKKDYLGIIEKLKLNEEEIFALDSGEKIDVMKPALFKVKRVTKDGKTYINKRITFEKKAPRKPEKG